MPDWLNGVTAEVDESLATLATRLALSWLCGWIVSLLARSKRPAETPDTLTLTLVLMSILIAMATQIIGDNIARAFSLVGALFHRSISYSGSSATRCCIRSGRCCGRYGSRSWPVLGSLVGTGRRRLGNPVQYAVGA